MLAGVGRAGGDLVGEGLRTHDLPDDVRRSLIEKMDRLSDMMQTMDLKVAIIKKKGWMDFVGNRDSSVNVLYGGTVRYEDF